MPLTPIQIDVLAVIARHRAPDSYIAGGAALNREADRLSDDIDIFHDDEREIVSRARADIAALRASGFRIDVRLMQLGIAEVVVGREGQETVLQWMDETIHRFFPIVQDPTLGWRLHDADLAVNKLIAAASRRQPRDAVDVERLDREYLPLGYLAWAAAGKSSGFSPVELLEEVVRNAMHPPEAFAAVRIARPVDPRTIVSNLKAARDSGSLLARALPTDHYGRLFIDSGGKPCAATPEMIAGGHVVPHGISAHGAWPAFPDVRQEAVDRLGC